MVPILLKTKLHPPAPGKGLVVRRRLVDRLQDGFNNTRNLSLLAAPAGFGKTTLLANWLQQSDSPCAWLSLDQDDNDPVVFWRYVLKALQTINPTLGQTSEGMLRTELPPVIKEFLTPLINDLYINLQKLVLVLDDYHVITDPVIHESMVFLINNQPETLHLVISTRADPPLPIARLRAQGTLTELRSEDLRFSVDEVEGYINEVMQFSLEENDCRLLEERTEGWAAGLQLAALSMQGRHDVAAFIKDFSGSHQFIMDYLADEVLYTQSTEVRDFLIETAILERLTAPLCAAVTGRKDSADLLEKIRRQNLFLSVLDDTGDWFRYHQLFRDLLESRMVHSYSPEKIREMHLRAGRWYADHAFLNEAVRHAFKAHDYELAADLIEASYKDLISEGRVATLVNWHDQLPESIQKDRPQLAIHLGWSLFLNAQFPRAYPILDAAYRRIKSMPASSERDALQGEVTAVLATMVSLNGDLTQAKNMAQEALSLLPAGDLISQARALRVLGVVACQTGDMAGSLSYFENSSEMARRTGNRFLAAEILSQLGVSYQHLAQLDQAEAVYQRILSLDEDPDNFTPAGIGYVGLAEIEIERDHLDQAEAYLRKSIQLCKQGGIGYAMRPSYYLMAIVQAARGDHQQALQELCIAETLYGGAGSRERAAGLAWNLVRVYLLLDDVESAWQWAVEGIEGNGARLEALPLLLREQRQVTLAKVLFSRGREGEAVAMLEKVLRTASEGERTARLIDANLMLAQVYQRRGDARRALPYLQQALYLAQPGGYIMTFLEGGDAVRDLLRLALRQDKDSQYILRLLKAFEKQGGILKEERSRPDQSQLLVEPLTERELEVLRLMAVGRSNREIAAELVVTLNTVKKHSSHIYGKLGVNNRSAAAAYARKLGLI